MRSLTDQIEDEATFPDDQDTVEVTVSAHVLHGKKCVGLDGLAGMFEMGTDTTRDVLDTFRDEFDMRRVTEGGVDLGTVTVTEDGEVADMSFVENPFDD